MDDWRANTDYTGEYERKGAAHKVVKWFWEVVQGEFSEEQRARLLQFVTGTSGVPAQGFRALQGNDGNIRKFTVNSIPEAVYVFPKVRIHRAAAGCVSPLFVFCFVIVFFLVCPAR